MESNNTTNKPGKEDNMNKNFLLISLEEKQTKKIAEVINNDSARKILDQLGKKECTESELSKVLDIPMSTVHYNLKQLQEANLVIVDEFHYSSKGKEVNHYKLANKYIIIAPKSDTNNFMEALKKIMPLTVITAIVGGIMTIMNLLTNNLSKATVGRALDTASTEAAPKLMTTTAGAAPPAPAAFNTAQEISRPFMQSSYIAWFLIGALAVIIIYFVYELVRKK